MTPLAPHVLNRRFVAPDTFVLRFSRCDIAFDPGQHIKVGLAGSDMREYSIYSGVRDPFLEILVKAVPGGQVSNELNAAEAGQPLAMEGPFGSFTIPEHRERYAYLFVANGTGIAPFHSFVHSYDDLDYTIVHGVGRLADIPEPGHYPPDRYVSCVTREPAGRYHGRVTGYLREHPVSRGTLCYLCGSCAMIYDVFPILTARGIPREAVCVETYY